MKSSENISKKPSESPSLNFKQLREEGIELIQELSGELWTDYNLHDPGVTTLEVLCYAITELGYRSKLLKDAFESDDAVYLGFVENYFFNQSELIPSLPLTRRDFELFIEKNHDMVLSAWFLDLPIGPSEVTIRGGYEIILMLKPDDEYGNLNTDVIQTTIKEIDSLLEINLFDEDNLRMNWNNIKEIKSCKLDSEAPDNFFEFEDFNCQVAVIFEDNDSDQAGSKKIHSKARVTLNLQKGQQGKSSKIDSYKKEIIEHLESPEFIEVIKKHQLKERQKAQLLTDIKQTLLPYRNLCEDFISLRVVNEQEVKLDVEIIVDDDAPSDDVLIEKVFDRLDAFLIQLLRLSKRPENRSKKNVLYASNIINEVLKIEGVESVKIININLFLDGIPTIPVNEETSFECIQLQRFSNYVPKISRNKSSVTFIRFGAKEKSTKVFGTKEFEPQKHFMDYKIPYEFIDKVKKRKHASFDVSFLKALRQYNSIRYDFPKNFNLADGALSANAANELKIAVKQFKSYLAFYERILIDYLDRLYSFNDLLSVKQETESEEKDLEKLREELPDLHLLGKDKVEDEEVELSKGKYEQLIRKNKILDHLLARFATRYNPILARGADVDSLERNTGTKVQILRDIPLITRERGLGIAIKPGVKEIWNGDLLSGFQKRTYRLLGVKNEKLLHLRLSKVSEKKMPAGFYLIEHILLANRPGEDDTTKKFNRDAGDLYKFIHDLAGSFEREPYSFQLTVVLPEWFNLWYDRKNRVEKAIKEEFPAHILPYFIWLSEEKMSEFENLYENWLKSLLRLHGGKSE